MMVIFRVTTMLEANRVLKRTRGFRRRADGSRNLDDDPVWSGNSNGLIGVVRARLQTVAMMSEPDARVLDPIQFVLIALAGWMNQRQLQTIEYLREENRVLREQLGDRLTPARQTKGKDPSF